MFAASRSLQFGFVRAHHDLFLAANSDHLPISVTVTYPKAMCNTVREAERNSAIMCARGLEQGGAKNEQTLGAQGLEAPFAGGAGSLRGGCLGGLGWGRPE